MKIKSVRVVTTTYLEIETDETDWPEYRRWSKGCWEQRMGESWETAHDDRLEEALSDYGETWQFDFDKNKQLNMDAT